MEDKRNKANKCSSSAEKDEINEVENISSTELNGFAKKIQQEIDDVKNYSSHRIVFRVNPLFYEVSPQAYNPKFVIIGPLLHYQTIYEHFEMQKWTYLDSFLQRAKTTKTSLNDFFQLIKKRALGRYYEETYFRTWNWPHKIQQIVGQKNKIKKIQQIERRNDDGSSDEFIKMVLVDASFIIELFLRAFHDKKKGSHESDGFRRDLFLAQNQLPFFILKDIYELAFRGNLADPSFLDLTCHFFSPYYNQNKSIKDSSEEYRKELEGAKHFTDLLRSLQKPDSSQEDCSKEKSLCSKFRIKWIKTKVVHLVDQIRSTLQLTSKKLEENLEAGEYLYSAVLLRDAGVEFKVSTSKCLLDIEFNKKNGELKIPPLKVDDSTEPFFRNLIAWEQHYYQKDYYISDYVFLMEYLIKSPKDVDLLVRNKILINQLGSNAAVATLFNNFCKNVPKAEENRYSDTFRKLSEYTAVRYHGWIANLRLQYFSTLWRGVATIAAVILLVLTLIQTICAVISL